MHKCWWLTLFALGCTPSRQSIQITVGGFEREFVLHVPRAVDPEEPPALVLMLHGTSGSGGKFFAISHWVQTADEITDRWRDCRKGNGCAGVGDNDDGGVITVFPSALTYCLGQDDVAKNGRIDDSEWRVTTKWASGSLGTDEMPLCPSSVLDRRPQLRSGLSTLRRGKGGQWEQVVPDDIEFMRAMIDAVEDIQAFDRSRIYVSGFSNGSQMAARIGLEMSDSVAAVAMSSAPPDTVGVSERPVPVLATAGTRDEVLLEFSVDPANPGQPLQEFPLDETLVNQGIFDVWLERLATQTGVDPTEYTYSRTTRDDQRLATFVFDTPLEGPSAEVQLVFLEDSTHEYPNGENYPVVMADLAWDFFDRFRLE